MDMVEIEILVMVDDQGQWQIGIDEEDLTTRWTDTIGDLADITARRLVRVKVKVPAPQVVELAGEVKPEPVAADGLKVA